jgi:hypothetical protein
MAIKIPFGDSFIICDTPEEAERILEMGEFLPGNKPRSHGPWTEQLLDTFLHRLGPDQKSILRILVAKTRVTADELRAAVNVDNNQDLAGIISGISKQAAALGIEARHVFGIENSRRSGVLSKSFFINEDLLKIARAANWPNPGSANISS